MEMILVVLFFAALLQSGVVIHARNVMIDAPPPVPGTGRSRAGAPWR
ncbi:MULTISPECIES: hypothetical protein [unclassified Micrococcus]|nr:MULTISPECIES: hypothetical protein [unclassified Micrococcus]